jgi:hypothetical protein
MGAVFGQTKDKKHHAIAYASKTLTGPQLNYATTKKELLAWSRKASDPSEEKHLVLN